MMGKVYDSGWAPSLRLSRERLSQTDALSLPQIIYAWGRWSWERSCSTGQKVKVGWEDRKTTRAEDAVKRSETKSLCLFERADMWIFMHILAFETHIESLWNNIYIHWNRINRSITFIKRDGVLTKLWIERKSTQVPKFRLQIKSENVMQDSASLFISRCSSYWSRSFRRFFVKQHIEYSLRGTYVAGAQKRALLSYVLIYFTS